MQSHAPPIDSAIRAEPNQSAGGPVIARRTIADETCAAAAADAASAQQPATAASILVVEDDPRSARLLSAHLQSSGYRVHLAHSSGEAQQSIASAVPDLILCDVCLPDMDGIQFTRWARGRAATAHVPIALVTSADDAKILARGLDAGADDFLSKPVNLLELRTRVRSLLRSKMLVDAIRAREEATLPFTGQSQQGLGDAGAVARDADPASVVIVEDSASELRLLEAQLTELGCRTRSATSAAAGLALVRAEVPDLVVLDLLLPDCDGYDFIAALKNDPHCAHVPILVVSAMADVQDRVKALELGGDDYIVKGFEHLEFEARVRRLLRLKQSIDQINSRCNQAMRLAVTDSLTGLYTYGFMQETLQRQLAHAQRTGRPYAMIFADVDHFKQVNDRYGHAAGDAVLRAVAEALRAIVRETDTLVRYGGEEFVVLLPHTGCHEGTILAQRMREGIESLQIPVDAGPPVQVTISLGVASYPDDAVDAESLVNRGDGAMYRAKQSGRNRVVACGSQPAESTAKARVLVVDDDEKNLRLFEAYLMPEGYQILEARNGAEAIEAARKQRPDVILMDGLMPILSGYDTCRRLKQDLKTQLLPVVLVTASNNREDKLRGIEAGADDFITKPIDRVELITRMRALIRQKRGTDGLDDVESVVFALARAIEGRDPMLRDHSERVSQYAVALGRAMGMSSGELDVLRRAGIVHDLGKIAVPDAILLKSEPLAPEEWTVVREHPETAYRMLKPLRSFADVAPAVRFHHERLDGSGYPLGLRGDNVPLIAQILAIADVYDALSVSRRYRSALSEAETFNILRDEARRGLHDPRLIEMFITQVAATAGAIKSAGALELAALP